MLCLLRLRFLFLQQIANLLEKQDVFRSGGRLFFLGLLFFLSLKAIHCLDHAEQHERSQQEGDHGVHKQADLDDSVADREVQAAEVQAAQQYTDQRGDDILYL